MGLRTTLIVIRVATPGTAPVLLLCHVVPATGPYALHVFLVWIFDSADAVVTVVVAVSSVVLMDILGILHRIPQHEPEVEGRLTDVQRKLADIIAITSALN